MTRSLVGARRMLDVLAIEPAVSDPEQPAEEPPPGVALSDPQSGLVVEPGHADGARLVRAARDGRGRRSHRALRRRRRRARRRPPRRPAAWPPCAAGSSSASPTPSCSPARCAMCSTPGGAPTTARSTTAIAVANAEDVVEALPEGLDAVIDERGRSFSGGQRQRLALTRALLADPEILVLVEPTSAVDAHTEARIALRSARGARRADDGRGHGEPARARPRRPRRARRGRAGRTRRAATASSCARTRATARSSRGVAEG